MFQDGLHLSPIASGIAFLPLGVGFAAASLAGRRLTARYGSRVLVIGAGTMAAGYVLLIATLLPGPASSGPLAALAMAPARLVAGAGQGIVSAPLIGVVLATVRPEAAGAGSGTVLTTNQLASSLALPYSARSSSPCWATTQDTGARPAERDFTAAVLGCFWLLLALALGVGVLAWRLFRVGWAVS